MTDLLPVILWLIPLLLLATIAGYLLLGRIFQQKTEQALKDLRLGLRRLHSERKQLESKGQAYSLRDPQPYRAAATGFRETLAAVRHELEEIERATVSLNERNANLKRDRLRTLFGAPVLWQLVRQSAAGLLADLANVQSNLRLATEFQIKLERLPWQVAQQGRELRRDLQTLSQRLGQLRQSGLYGDTFEAAARIERQVQVALAQAPALFLDGSEQQLLQTASKEETALVFALVQANQPDLQDLLHQSRAWETDSQLTAQKVAAMRKALDELEGVLKGLPASLNTVEEQASIRRLEEVAQNLQSSAARLEIESIVLVGQEAEHVRTNARESNQRLRQARSESERLAALLADLSAGFRDLSLQLAALGACSVYPIDWEVSLNLLAQLNRQSNDLGEAGKQRTPAQVNKDLLAATEFSLQQKQLGEYILEIEEAHVELVALLADPEINQMPEWAQKARAFVAQASGYAPENWPRLENLAKLNLDLDALREQIEILLSGNRSSALSELQVIKRLDQTRQLSDDYRRVAQRVESIRTRWQDLQRKEAQASAELEDLQKSLSQVQLIANSNPYLAGVASQEIERLKKSCQDMRGEIDQPQRGAVEKKARQADALNERALESAHRWLEQLKKEIQAQFKELSQTLHELEAIARLEDASVLEAQRLLSSEQSNSAASQAGKNRLAWGDLILEFKRSSSLWQECTAAQRSLANVHQLVETYREASFQHDQAHDQVSTERQRKRAWPPVATNLEFEQRDIEILDQEWSNLKERSGKAISLVAQYSNLASRYQNLAERIRQSAARRQQEQNQVEQLEETISDLAEPWEQLMERYQDNPSASREIRDLLADLSKQMNQIESDYLANALDYDGVVQQMKALQRRVRYYQVALDDDHALDASGRVTRRRQSERE